MTTSTSAGTFRRAPGQRGGNPWKGPRKRLSTWVPLDLAEEAVIRAGAAGLPVSDLLGAALRQYLARA